MSGRTAKDVVDEMFRRQQAGDDTRARRPRRRRNGQPRRRPAGPRGPEAILGIIEDDLGPVTVEQHHLVGEGDLVAQHLTLHGTHRASTMPLLADAPVSGGPAAWTFIHLWRVVDGMIVEHWACRDDMGLREQLIS